MHDQIPQTFCIFMSQLLPLKIFHSSQLFSFSLKSSPVKNTVLFGFRGEKKRERKKAFYLKRKKI